MFVEDIFGGVFEETPLTIILQKVHFSGITPFLFFRDHADEVVWLTLENQRKAHRESRLRNSKLNEL